MPSTQVAASERRNDRTLSPHTVTHEPPKLKTTLKTPPKQATNPLQFVKVGPCSLYRTAQEQLQKVQEVKKIKQEIRDDPEDWQSNLDNWKSSRRKRQEHIIERVVEVKKLELEEHDRQRRRSKTFSEMMEERGQRGRKLSISLAMYNEEDANDLSDLGIGTSSGKSSISGDTHDDTQSVLSDRESEVEKNQLHADNVGQENGNDGNGRRNGKDGNDSTNDNDGNDINADNNINDINEGNGGNGGNGGNDDNDDIGENESISDCNSNNNNGFKNLASQSSMRPMTLSKLNESSELIKNGYLKNGNISNRTNGQECDSRTTATAGSPEPEECRFDGGAIRNYMSHAPQNIMRRSIDEFDEKLDNAGKSNSPSFNDCKETCENSHSYSNQLEQQPVVKVDIVKRREIFEKASRENLQHKNNNNGDVKLELSSGISIKERLSNLESQKTEVQGDFPINRPNDRVSPKSACIEQEPKHRGPLTEELEGVKPLRERLFSLEKLVDCKEHANVPLNISLDQTVSEFCTASIKDRLMALDRNRYKESDKRSPNCFFNQQTGNRGENLTPSERSSSPDSEYRTSHAIYHQSQDSLDASASSEPDASDHVQGPAEFEQEHVQRQQQQQQQQQRQYQQLRHTVFSSTSEICNEIDCKDPEIQSGCSVIQTKEAIEEEMDMSRKRVSLAEEKLKTVENIETMKRNCKIGNGKEEKYIDPSKESRNSALVLLERGTADFSCSPSSALGESLLLPKSPTAFTNANPPRSLELSSSHSRPIIYQSPKISPRRGGQELPSPMSPETTGRSPSKIPTPSSRRQTANRAQSSPKQKETSPCLSPPRLSEIPVPVKVSCSLAHNPRIHLAADTRRHTVLELCEKVLVPRGQQQATPFITVERTIECQPECTTEPDCIERVTSQEP